MASGAADAVCLKVGRRGGISGLLATAALAQATGAEVYLASTFDGPLGIAAAVHCAAALRVQAPCGLATLSLLDLPVPECAAGARRRHRRARWSRAVLTCPPPPSHPRSPSPLLLVGAASASAAAQDAPCPQGVQCRTVTVPLDRSGRGAGHRRAARRDHPGAASATRAPILALAGGPGQATVPFTADFADELAIAWRRPRPHHARHARHRLVGPGPLPRLRAGLRGVGGRVGDVLRARAGRPRRSFYTSADVAADIDAVRRRLGVPKIALYGVSYGTRVALEYARRYPRAHGPGDPRLAARGERGRPVLARRPSRRHPARPAPDLRLRLRRHRASDRGPAGARRAAAGGAAARCRPRRPQPRDAPDHRGRPVHAAGHHRPVRPAHAGIPIVVEEALKGRYASLIGLARAADQLDSLGTLRDFSPGLFAATLCEESPIAWDRRRRPATRLGRRCRRRSRPSRTPP